MSQELQELRNKIDDADKRLVSLIAERLSLVARVGRVKSRDGVPVYDPAREASMLAKRRAEAEEAGISPDVIEDVLRRIMRESYNSESREDFKCVNPKAGKVVVVGGFGQLGKLFVKLFKSSHYEAEALSRRNWDRAEELLHDAGLVIISVPINSTPDVIAQVSKMIPENAVLADITSVKTGPLETMLRCHKGPVVGLHPLFGPDVQNFAKQLIVCCGGRMPEKYSWVIEQMKIWGVNIYNVEAAVHDRAMSVIQGLRHFTTFAYGVNLMSERYDVARLVNLSSPVYRLEIMMVGRLFAQDPALYAEIIMSSKQNLEVIRRYADAVSKCLKLIEKGDEQKFIELFLETRKYFGDYAQKFMEESRRLLAVSSDSGRRGEEGAGK